MLEHTHEIFFALDLIAFLATISLHLVKTNRNLIRLYFVQSLIVTAFLALTGFTEDDNGLLWVAFLMFGIKAIAAPMFFSRLVRRYGARLAINNYLSTPLTLIALMALVDRKSVV